VGLDSALVLTGYGMPITGGTMFIALYAMRPRPFSAALRSPRLLVGYNSVKPPARALEMGGYMP